MNCTSRILIPVGEAMTSSSGPTYMNAGQASKGDISALLNSRQPYIQILPSCGNQMGQQISIHHRVPISLHADKEKTKSQPE